jgi:hypothetical protein
MLVCQRGDIFDGAFKRDTRNTFKTLVGNPETHVDIRPVKPEWIEEKRAYMKGGKTGEGKAEKVAMDRVWRAQNNLEEYYIRSNGLQASSPSEGSSQEASDDASSTASAEGSEDVSDHV